MPPTSPSQRATNRNFHILCVQLTLLKTMWNHLRKRSMIFSFQFFFTRRSPSLLSCENYLSFRQHKGGLGIPDLKAEASQQYAASKLIIAPHVELDLLRSTMQARDNDANSWLNAVTLKEQNLTLNRQQFRDSLRLHYNLQLADLPSHCACGDRFTVSHALSCKRRVLLHKDMMASRTFSHLCSAKSARMSR